MFEVATGRTLKVLRGARGGLTAVQFGADGRHILTAGKDGAARLYDCGECLPLAELLEAGPHFISTGRTLTPAESARYLH